MSYSSLDFFAGSGLVRLGLDPDFRTVWANDIDETKAAVYRANFPSDKFLLGSIADVDGRTLPRADLAWASFPCQDLSLAGNLGGLHRATRSGLFWEWLRVLDELDAAGNRVPVLAAENVIGFLLAHDGKHFRKACGALIERGYQVGGLTVDAKLFLPQSRPRAFLIAVSRELNTRGLTQSIPSDPFHARGLIRAASGIAVKDWIWWHLPLPNERPKHFQELCEWDAPCDDESKTQELFSLMSGVNSKKVEDALRTRLRLAGTGYRRTRTDIHGKRAQRLEVRFDGVAGCLRAPNGGSSRQVVVLVQRDRIRTRLMTVRECARLMGAPDTFVVPGSYNDGYRAMGDAVAVPVTRWLAKHLLAPLAGRFRKSRSSRTPAA